MRYVTTETRPEAALAASAAVIACPARASSSLGLHHELLVARVQAPPEWKHLLTEVIDDGEEDGLSLEADLACTL